MEVSLPLLNLPWCDASRSFPDVASQSLPNMFRELIPLAGSLELLNMFSNLVICF